MQEKGYLCLVLHAHLPYVRHPEYNSFLEEDWLYEAITETYIPLVNAFESMEKDGIDFRITMSLTPPLMSMLADPLLQERYVRHLNKLIELSEKEIDRTRWDPKINHLAYMYNDIFTRSRYVFEEKYKRNLVNAFKKFQDKGNLEIITCCATHGFLPLMDINKKAVRAQVKIAVDSYEKYLGRKPRGIWLAECGYHPDHDWVLKEFGINYFFTDAHGILHASHRPKYGVFAPVYCKSGVAAFGRDIESSKQVWSAEEGYPGDFWYREFYRDAGYDLEYEYVKPYICDNGIRKNVGIKYYRITGKTNYKEPYDPYMALDRASSHAGNFLFNRERQVDFLYDFMGRKPIIVSPYDAELFGHWWFEGPQFINFLLRKTACDQKTVRLITPSEYLAENPVNQVTTPSFSSWGNKGYSEVWLEGSNDWIYRHLHQAENRMTELARMFPNAYGLKERALKQAARELVLAESSDWAFIMKTGTMVEYAVKRTKDHIARFTRLYEDIKNDTIDEAWLREIEAKDNIFEEVNYAVYA